MKYKLTIKLLSDACFGSGEGNGIDMDIAPSFDEEGFPFIGGRRIKGILLENAQFLLKHGLNCVKSPDGTKKGYTDGAQISENHIKQLFGTGEKRGLLKISNAKLENMETVRTALEDIRINHPEKTLFFSTDQVRKAFSGYRYSTEIEENGIAKKKSLRKIGVIRKGEVFVSNIEIDENSLDNQLDETNRSIFDFLLNTSVKLMRGIGISRKRGLGEVECELKADASSEVKKTEICRGYNLLEANHSCYLEYKLKLLSPAVTECDYIPGSMLQGYFISKIAQMQNDKDNVHEFLSGLRFSMGYLSKDGHRYLPSPLSMVYKKADSAQKTGYPVYSLVDGYIPEEGVQYMKLGSYYRTAQDCNAVDRGTKNHIDKVRPKSMVEYHLNKENKQLYSIHSLQPLQEFVGGIYGDSDKLKMISDILNSSNGMVYVGGSSNTQYGRALMTLEVKTLQKEEAFEEKREYVMEFLSDAVLLDQDGVNKADFETLLGAIPDSFSLVDDAHIFMSTSSVGGYHAKWNLPKRKFVSISKGTQILIKFDGNRRRPDSGKSNENNLCVQRRHGFLGILQGEGYGEYRIREKGAKEFEANSEGEICENHPSDSSREAVSSRDQKNCKNENSAAAGAVLQKILLNQALECLKSDAESAAKEYFKTNKSLSSSKAMRLISAHKVAEQSDGYFVKFVQYCTENFTGKSNADILVFAQFLIESFVKLMSMERMSDWKEPVWEEPKETIQKFRHICDKKENASKDYLSKNPSNKPWDNVKGIKKNLYAYLFEITPKNGYMKLLDYLMGAFVRSFLSVCKTELKKKTDKKSDREKNENEMGSNEKNNKNNED